MGCPSPRVQKGAFGAILMKTPATVVDIIQGMVKIGVTIPITVKCRIGVDNLDSYEYLHDFVRDQITKKGSHLLKMSSMVYSLALLSTAFRSN